jgi:hypothetical protein
MTETPRGDEQHCGNAADAALLNSALPSGVLRGPAEPDLAVARAHLFAETKKGSWVKPRSPRRLVVLDQRIEPSPPRAPPRSTIHIVDCWHLNGVARFIDDSELLDHSRASTRDPSRIVF